MRQSLEICVAQMTSTNAHAGNIETARGMIAAAAAHGAELVCLPEAANMSQEFFERFVDSSLAKQVACHHLLDRLSFERFVDSLLLKREAV